MLYFDHAASSFPKPNGVGEAMKEAVDEFAANPGRGGHALSQKAASIVKQARSEIAHFFEAPHANHVWFYQNATMALNQAILGFPFSSGDHIITTSYEHNSVLRPLHRLNQEMIVQVTYLTPDDSELFQVEDVLEHITDQTKMIVISHASNVTGAVFPVKELGEQLKDRSITVVVDASQTAGKLDIQMKRDHIDLLAVAGHKGLLGPQGTGALISYNDYHLKPLILGGTGAYSELETQPPNWPERYEAGTLNTPGIAGLLAGVQEIKARGVATIQAHEEALMQQFLEGMSTIDAVTCFGPTDLKKRVAVVSFHVKHIASHELAMILDNHYQIAVRAGLHCSPKTHQHLQTADEGLVRVSFGPYNTIEEVQQLIDAINDIVEAFTE
ncbi:aminotransferase class V-fold PLP-dependent enzyme [Alkalihalobacillus sp. FSL W8-0930]